LCEKMDSLVWLLLLLSPIYSAREVECVFVKQHGCVGEGVSCDLLAV